MSVEEDRDEAVGALRKLLGSLEAWAEVGYTADMATAIEVVLPIAYAVNDARRVVKKYP